MWCGSFRHRMLMMAARRQAIAEAAMAEYHALRNGGGRQAAQQQQQQAKAKGRALASAAVEEMQCEDVRRGQWGLGRGWRAAPTSWSPFDALESVFPNRNLRSMIERMDRMVFDDPFFARNGSTGGRWGLRPAGVRGGRSPWDFAETEDAFRVRLDLPGLAKEEVKVVVEDGELIISAERAARASEGGAEEIQRSSTRIMLPENVVAETTKAQLKDGVLNVTVPKVVEEPAQKTVIDVPLE